MGIAEAAMEGPVLIVDNRGIGHQIAPENEIFFFSGHIFLINLGATLSKN